MAITKGEIAIDVFSALGMYDGLTEPTPGEVEYSMRVMEQLVAMWERKGIFLGYKYALPDVGPDAGDDSGLSDTAVLAVVNNVAVKIAKKFGRPVTMDLKNDAHEGYVLLFDTELPQYEQNQYQPEGAGLGCGFMPVEEPITIQDDGTLTL